MTEFGQKVEISTLPQGIGKMTAAYTILIAIDPTLFWNVLGHFVARHLNTMHAPGVGFVNLSSDTVLGIGAIIGVVTTLNFVWFPLLLLDGRTPVAVSAFRKLCWAIVFVHPVLVVIVLINAVEIGFRSGGLITPLAFVAVPATFLLYLIVVPLLTMKWLDLTAPPESWEKLIGIDGSGRRSIGELGGVQSSVLFSTLLPPVACFRARWYWRSAITGVLWAAGIVLLFVDPLRSILAFVAAAAVGRQVGLSGRSAKPMIRPLDQAERVLRLRNIFTPIRLRPPPPFVAAGILSSLFLMPAIMDAGWLGIHLGETSAGTILGQNSIAPAIMPFLTIAFAIPTALILPLGFRFGVWYYRVIGVIIVIVYLILFLYFWRVTTWPFGAAALGVSAVMRIAALVIAAFLPLIVAIAASLPGVRHLPGLTKPPKNFSDSVIGRNKV